MSVTRKLIRLYPNSLRDRWGSGLEVEAQAGGWRSWPNLVVSILDMWLHPVVWPAESTAQRRGRAAVMAVAVALTGWLLGHLVVQQGTLLPPGIARSWSLDVCDVLVLLGLALVAPHPRPTVGAVTTLLRKAACRLVPPLVMGAAVVAGVHLGVDQVSPMLRGAMLACWWTTLALGAIQVCNVVACLGADVVVPPGPRRLRVGIWTLAAAFAIAGSIVLGSDAVSGYLGPLSGTLGAGLLLLTITCAGILRDLCDLPPTD